MNYKIFGIIPIIYLIYLVIKFFQKNDVDKMVGKIIGKDNLQKILTRVDILFGFKKKNSNGNLTETTPIWVKILIFLMYLILIILATGSIIGIIYFAFIEK